jgi:ATP-dependent DNA ligase
VVPGGGEWVDRLYKLDGLASIGDVVVDGDVVALSADGRADFELLAARIHVVVTIPTTIR